MEIVGGFMVMMSIISLFLAVVWLIMPFVVFAIKGKQDRTLEVLEAIEKRLANLEARLQPDESERNQPCPTGDSDTSTGSPGTPSSEHPTEHTVIQPESAPEKKDPEVLPEV